jgi:N-acetylneuraminic acid mutarotase
VKKGVALMLVLVFLTASSLMVAKPVFSSAAVAEDLWVSKAPMHVARGNLGIATVNGKVYAIGGSTRTGSTGSPLSPSSIVGTNEEYDPATDTWTFRASMPTPRYNFAIVEYQNKIYCIGGYIANASSRTGTTRTGINEVYDPSTDTWENKTPMPTPRSDLQANVVNGKIYLIGGFITNTTSRALYSTTSLNEVYDPATDTWTQKAPSPQMVYDYALAALDEKIYVLCGSNDAGHTTKNQIYDTQTDIWSTGSSAPTYFMHGSAVATVGIFSPERIYVFNKPATNMASGPVPVYSNQIYDPKTDTWTTGADMPTEREYFGAVNVNDTIYVVGGQTFYYPDLESWSSGPYVTAHATVEQYIPLEYGTISPSPTALSNSNPETSSPQLLVLLIIALAIILSVSIVILRRRNKKHLSFG